MQYKIKIPQDFQPCDLATLLETHWLVPRKVRHFLRMKKNILINEQLANFHDTVNAEDIITLTLEESDYPPYQVTLGDAEKVTVLYEDEQLIIVEKPIKMKTHPNEPGENDTLLNHLAAYLEPYSQLPYVVHRLDKETSGLVLFAKNPFILPILGSMLEQKRIKRNYQAIIDGQLSPSKITVNKKIGRDRHDRKKRCIDERGGQVAITHFSTLEVTPTQSLINCQLDTGRTHQIRVHLLSIGHPIVGDPLYNPKSKAPRLMLHAYELTLTHPLTNELITAKSQERLYLQ